MTSLKLFSLSALFVFVSCSGGGGGSSDGESSQSGKRTTDSAIRIIHSSVDSVPLGATSNGVYLGKANYLEQSNFFKVAPGVNNISILQGDRISQVLSSLSLNVLDKVEYSVFVYGTNKDGDFKVKILEEPVIRPESGMARLQVLNGLSDASKIRYSIIGSIANTDLTFGNTSGFIDLPAGIYDVSISGPSGSPLGVASITLVDRGELTIVASGKLDYSFFTIKTYEDLD